MFLNAKNGSLPIGGTDMDYVSFGNGNKNLIILPGLGDGLSTVRGTALVFAIAYRKYAKTHTVYIFSRKNRLEKNYSTKDMAKDQAEAMKTLGIANADMMGISQGGMIAQHVAIDYTDLVNKLVLVVSLSKQNATVQKVVGNWIKMAARGDYKSLMVDTAEKSYSPKRLKRYKILYPLLGRIKKITDFSRFLIQAEACMRHDAHDALHKITCPTLIIGGDDDRIAGTDAAAEIAREIKDSVLFIYEGLGHAVYEEASDFNERVLHFLNSDV